MEDPLAGADAEPCPECPAMLLDQYLKSPEGRWIGTVIDLDYAIQAGIRVGLGDILYPEFLLLRQLTEERNKFDLEEARKNRRG